jgi:mannose-1-phosphate guanylyltransferase
VRRIGLVVGSDTGPFVPLVDLLAPHGIDVFLVPEPTPLDTAGGVRSRRSELDEPVLVLNGDVLSDLDVAALAERHHGRARRDDLADAGRGHVDVRRLRARGDRITAFVEKPAPGTLPGHDTVNAGAYVLAPGSSPPSPRAAQLRARGLPGPARSGAVVAGEVHEGVWTDLGTPERFLAGQRLVLDGALDVAAARRPRRARRRAPGVRVGRDVLVAGRAARRTCRPRRRDVRVGRGGGRPLRRRG